MGVRILRTGSKQIFRFFLNCLFRKVPNTNYSFAPPPPPKKKKNLFVKLRLCSEGTQSNEQQ
jgi:hypothetical protein